MEAPFTIENKVCSAIADKKEEELRKFFSKTTSVIYNGKKYTGDVFADKLLTTDLYHYSMGFFEVHVADNISEEISDETKEINNEDSMIIQVSYVLKKYKYKSEDCDSYMVSSTWKRSESENELKVAIISVL